ncbi:class I SAM-dependent methyltransferase [Dethiobacter alkaliphilus]|uniref:class I SAM-dependent methyltransferase n=1 Tax=Dethiobacter alkaliphilus TaxID=427926 RepID=UPI002225E5CD|nr:methyltransferase [Dethiobacter alkaliphilus]MCW3490919.1 methyltransferase [Dethiobacter alkaliphilus]
MAAIAIQLTRTVFPLPGRDIQLDVVDDVEALITDLSDADLVPCWAEIWPAARSLARYVWEHLHLEGQSVMELGSGLGLPGAVCGVKGADVTFSDYNQDAVDLSVHNAKINGVQATGHLGDWRNFDLKRRFDWIIGSDVFYDPKLNPYVLEIYRHNLQAGGQLLLSHQRRQHTYDFVAAVKADLELEEIRFDLVERDEESVYGQFVVSIHHLRPANI